MSRSRGGRYHIGCSPPARDHPLTKPFIPAADTNRHAIAPVLERVLPAAGEVLEIGAGTGQHAVHFAACLPRLRWLATERPGQLDGLRAWIEDADLPNLAPPEPLDVEVCPWPVSRADAVYSANTAHFMSEAAVTAMFSGVSEVLEERGPFVLYGPFNYGGRYVSEGNRRLDAWLRAHDPVFGIRDFEALDALAASVGLVLEEDCAMPANNRTLVWRRSART